MIPKKYTGTVERGEGTAKKLGFPTVNIPLNDTSVSGIYASKVTAEGAEYEAAVFADPVRGVLEAHLLDFSGDLYGKKITVALCEKIRESERFHSEAELVRAIVGDADKTRVILKRWKPGLS